MRILPFLFMLWIGQTAAHEVHHAVETTAAVAVRLTYADGEPFAYEAFEATPEGGARPAQVGRTDAQGRAVFVPGTATRWRIKAFSADGHGVDVRIEVPAVAPPTTGTAPPPDTPNRASLLVFGLGLILGGFGLYQLRLRKKP